MVVLKRESPGTTAGAIVRAQPWSLATSSEAKIAGDAKGPGATAGAFVVAGVLYNSMHHLIEELLVKRISLPHNGRHGLARTKTN
jgi:hypothetical protein